MGSDDDEPILCYLTTPTSSSGSRACSKCRLDKRYCFWPSQSAECYRCVDRSTDCVQVRRKRTHSDEPLPRSVQPRLAERRRTPHSRFTNAHDQHISDNTHNIINNDSQLNARPYTNIANDQLAEYPLPQSFEPPPGVATSSMSTSDTQVAESIAGPRSSTSGTMHGRNSPICELACCEPLDLSEGIAARCKLAFCKDRLMQTNKYCRELDYKQENNCFRHALNEYVVHLENVCSEAMDVPISCSRLHLFTACILHAAFDLCERLICHIKFISHCPKSASFSMRCFLALQWLDKVADACGSWFSRTAGDADPDAFEYYRSRNYHISSLDRAPVVQNAVEAVLKEYYIHWI